MPRLNSTQQKLSWWEKRSENMVNLALGLAIALCAACGLYIGISLHL